MLQNGLGNNENFFSLNSVMTGSTDNPDDKFWATSGTLFYNPINGALYRNESAGIGAGSSWTANLL